MTVEIVLHILYYIVNNLQRKGEKWKYEKESSNNHCIVHNDISIYIKFWTNC